MSVGYVEAIYIAPGKGEPTTLVEEAKLVPGKGIIGDRYFDPQGPTDVHSKSGRELTLIEIEAIDAMRSLDGINISVDRTRRNIVTRGISLNGLVGKEFSIGSIRLQGIRLCEPCDYLANRTDRRILDSMVHRGGLRANILNEGIIHINDQITFLDKEVHD